LILDTNSLVTHRAIFVERANRFGAWVELAGRREYVHLPDPGRLKELLVPGNPVWLRRSARPGRKTGFSLVMAQENGHWISLDTGVPTQVVRHALQAGELPEFAGYTQVRPEFPYGHSRLDFLLTGARGPCLLEVKSVTLVVKGIGLFPDAVSSRATRHLQALIQAVGEGYRAAVLFVVQRDDARAVAANSATDPKFAATLRQAAAAGVEFYARTCQVSPLSITLKDPVPVLISRDEE